MKGTYDVIDDIAYMQLIEKKILQVSKLFHYKEIRTPHFEASQLFHRGVGETTDIISKETYDFIDRGKRENTLRPEGTAGVVRAYIENKLYADPIVPYKVFYYGSMFRYERPQKGRFREFRQFGAEAFGSDSPLLDAETIAYAVTFLKSLKLKDVTVTLNGLGDRKSKEAYHKALKMHLKDDIQTLCKDCQKRYDENPLRILDCKVDQDHPVLINAPKPLDYLTTEDKAHFDKVCSALEAMNIVVEVDPSLVRGLDYYTHTVFEIKVSKDLLGNQNAICGGGRYNHLVETLDGPPTPAVGFSFGIERLIVALKAANVRLDDLRTHLYLITLGEQAQETGIALLQKLRLGGIIANMDFMGKSLKAQFKQSEHHKARCVVVLGEDELNKNQVEVKDQETNEVHTTSLDDLYVTLIDILTQPSDCESCEQGGKKT